MSRQSAGARRLRRLGTQLAIVFGALLATLFGLEVAFRSTHWLGARVSWFQPDSLLAFRFVPASHYWYRGENDHPITGRINSWGWRDREWSRKQDPGVARIAVLGDSYVEAFQVESDSTFLRMAERTIQSASGRRVELMNFGRSGFTQTEQLLILQSDVLPFAPTIVVVCFLPSNDIADVRPETAPLTERPFFRPDGDTLRLDTSFRQQRVFRLKVRIDPLKRRSALVSLVAERYTLLRAMRAGRPPDLPRNSGPPEKVSGPLSLCTNSPDPRLAQSYALCKRLLGEIASVCRQHQIPMLLVCLDTGAHVVETEEQLRRLDPSFDAFFFERDLAAQMDSLGAAFLGLQGPMRQASQAGARTHWVHWSYDGHRVVARTLAPKLIEMLATREK